MTYFTLFVALGILAVAASALKSIGFYRGGLDTVGRWAVHPAQVLVTGLVMLLTITGLLGAGYGLAASLAAGAAASTLSNVLFQGLINYDRVGRFIDPDEARTWTLDIPLPFSDRRFTREIRKTFYGRARVVQFVMGLALLVVAYALAAGAYKGML